MGAGGMRTPDIWCMPAEASGLQRCAWRADNTFHLLGPGVALRPLHPGPYHGRNVAAKLANGHQVVGVELQGRGESHICVSALQRRSM